jgi:hypothetical protein
MPPVSVEDRLEIVGPAATLWASSNRRLELPKRGPSGSLGSASRAALQLKRRTLGRSPSTAGPGPEPIDPMRRFTVL